MSAVVGGLALQAACVAEDGAVRGRVQVVDRTTSALLSGELASVNGTYGAGCTDRSGSWSLEIAEAAVLDNAELSVVLNDTGCVLTMTELRTTGGLQTAVPSIALAATYAGSASAFGTPIDFYANAKLSAVDFAGDFVLTFLYSDDPALATDSNTASFEVTESSVSAQSVDAPDYSIDVSGIAVQTDAEDVVQSASGNAVLTENLVTGQTYVVVNASGLDTYAEIDSAYLGATPAALTTNLPASDFTLVGTDLTSTQVRTLIVANISDDVAGYQAFEITFHPAP